MSFDAFPWAWFRPGRPLVLVLLAATLLVWAAGDLSPSTAVDALRSELAFEQDYIDHDYEAAAENGAKRIALPVVPPSPLLQGVIADAMRRAGREREGLEVAEQALAFADEILGPDSREAANARNNLSWYLLCLAEPTQSELEEALRLADEAVGQEGGNPYFLGTLGTAELRLGRLEQAREHLGRSVELHREAEAKATDGMILAIVLAKLGQRDEALRVYHEAAADGRPDKRYWLEARELLGIQGGHPPDTPEKNDPPPPSRPQTRPGPQA